jgi:hypothetical protein
MPGSGGVWGGAAYRNRTDDLPITRGKVPRSRGLTCTDSTANRTRSAVSTGISWLPVPRPVPRPGIIDSRFRPHHRGLGNAVLSSVHAGIDRQSLDYEPYDVHLSRLERSLVSALTSTYRRLLSVTRLGVSPVPARPAVSRAQIRAQIWRNDLWGLELGAVPSGCATGALADLRARCVGSTENRVQRASRMIRWQADPFGPGDCPMCS